MLIILLHNVIVIGIWICGNSLNWLLNLNLSFRVGKQQPEVFYKKRCSQNFRKIYRKVLCQSLFFNKVAGLRPTTLLKKRLWCRCFPVNFAKFLRTSFLQNTSGGCFWHNNMHFFSFVQCAATKTQSALNSHLTLS